MNGVEQKTLPNLHITSTYSILHSIAQSLVCVGNPFLLMKTEKYVGNECCCWRDYIHRCIESTTLHVAKSLKLQSETRLEHLQKIQQLLFLNESVEVANKTSPITDTIITACYCRLCPHCTPPAQKWWAYPTETLLDFYILIFVIPTSSLINGCIELGTYGVRWGGLAKQMMGTTKIVIELKEIIILY